MRQQTFAEGAFEIYAQPTRRAAFPADRERVVPWSKLCTGIRRTISREKAFGRRWAWRDNTCCERKGRGASQKRKMARKAKP